MEVILTSHRYGERELLEELKELGDFYQTGLKDVIRGARALFLKLLRDGVGLE